MGKLKEKTKMKSQQTGSTDMENSNKKEWRTPELETLNVQETAQDNGDGPLPPPQPS